ncbi:SDR family NAD(P)-dependent oxidoreductase [Novosphingobium sp. MD-1]|uniref:SDR family NAD(P)-dependent oxidoreductase n=1 Tax=Novosphingobium sp. MD-1 TaxID=1630648 RepID=UPI00061CD79A|nr:SDR family NAD(P)-dependent oxidoreductase [Novosphingobium sp. MD-1]GAO56746.1 oxidoreductase of short-chain dehydrogenase/reductase family [Novosphingobium sp. MD-1]
MTFNGQTVWITGASSGIGAAMARALAKDGAHLILSGRNAAALEEVAADCGNALVLPFDVGDADARDAAVAAAWEWALARSGGVDMLVNNAGLSQRSLAVDTAFSVYDHIVGIDLLAPIALTQALLPRMVERGEGRFVMMSSVAGKVGVPMRTAYCAAKFGLIGYADALRAETAHLGLKVHVIAPGSVRTNVSRNAMTADGSLRGSSDHAIENGIAPEEAVAEMLAAILRDEREIVIARGIEQQMGELRRTPDALFDQVAAMMAAGYAEKMQREG